MATDRERPCDRQEQHSKGAPSVRHRADFCARGFYNSGMAKNPEPVDDLLDALVWMRRKAKRHEAVDDLIDALMKMRRKAKKKVAKKRRPAKKRTKSRR